MEIAMLREYEAPGHDTHDMRYPENSFSITSDDLPRFCWVLLIKGAGWLSQLTLSVGISHNMSTHQGEDQMDTQTDVRGNTHVE